MKRTLYSLCIGALALSLGTAQGEDNTNNGRHSARSEGTSASVRASARTTGVKSSANLRQTGPAVTARTYRTTTPQTYSGATYRNRVHRNNPTVTGGSNVGVNRDRNFTNRSNVVVNRDRNFTNRSNVVVNRDRNFTNRNVAVNRDRTYTNRNTVMTRDRTFANRNFTNRNVVVNNNWRGSRFAGRNYAAFRDYHRQYHDRGWWRSHYNRIVFVGGGWYYWNSGYWFPAWGYDSSAYYPYDGPIYAYNDLAPNDVIADVQSQLQRDGYYPGPIDGSLGPQTRAAIAAFQADHGLAVTSAIDEPTLASLGIS